MGINVRLGFGLQCSLMPHFSYDVKVACQMILDKMGLKGYQIAKTTFFLRPGQMASLDVNRIEVLRNAARTIQMQTRIFIARMEFVALRRAAIQVQSFTQGR